MKTLITIALSLLLPSLAAAECTISLTYKGTTWVRSANCDKGTVSGKVGDPVTVAPMAAPAPTPTPTPTPAGTIIVPAGAGVQPAVDQAAVLAKTAPAFVQLAAGNHPGNLVLPRTNAPYPITITAEPTMLLAAGTRMTPAATVPHIVPGSAGTTTVLVQGDNYILRGFAIDVPGVGLTSFDIDATVTPRPSNITLDQMLIRGSETTGGHRGVGANGVNVTVTNSWIDRMWEVGRDSQSIAIWDAPGPLRIENNYIEAGSEGILLGGSIPTCACVPTDVIITRNTITKDPAWRTMSPSPQIKNLIEIKFGRRVTITDNDLSKNWPQAQTGWSVLVTTMGVEGTAWTVIDGVTIAHNRIHDISGGLNIAAVSGPVQHVSVHDNVWQNIDSAAWGGDGRWVMVQGGTTAAKSVSDISITHESVIGISGNQFLGLYDNPIVGFVLTHIVAEHRDYGIFSSDGFNVAALASHAPGAVVKDNAIVGPAADWLLPWPAGTFLLDVPIRAQFDVSGKLLATSPLAALVTSDGVKVGAQP